MCKEIVQERPPFDVAWQIIDGLKVRYATGGSGGERVMLLSPWPESIFAFAPVWVGLAKQFNVLAIDLPGFGRSEARDALFAPQKMGAGQLVRRSLHVTLRTSGPTARIQPRSDRGPRTAAADGSNPRRR